MLRILLADDSANDRFLVARLLRAELGEIDIVEAGTPEAFREALPPPPYDLVVTDYQLQWTTGLQVIAAIRERDRACPIIMFTGTGSEEIAVEAMKVGLSDYVLKSPKHLVRLGPAARRAIDHRRQQDAVAEAEAGRRAAAEALARRNEELQAQAKRLESLPWRLLEVQEAERRYLARELHDEIGQALTAVKISLYTARLQPDRGASNAVLDDTMAVVDHALGQVRNMSLQLRPPMLDDLGLDAAARWLVHGQSRPASPPISLSIDLPPERLPKPLETACFRILQESLTNIARHARAATVVVSLAVRDGSVLLTVVDDGVGFDVQGVLEAASGGRSLGLLNMLERAHLAGGRLDIVSGPGRGTTLTAELPIAGGGTAPGEAGAKPGAS